MSELYETVQSVYSLPAIIEVLRSPRSPSFAVTPKGERLDEDFISSLSKPFYILFLLNMLFLAAGVLRLMFQPETASVAAITMIWASINVIFILAAIGVMLEKAQRRSAYRISTEHTNAYPSSLLHDGKEWDCTLLNISHSGLGLRVDDPSFRITHGDVVYVKIFIPALGRVGCFHARVVGTHEQDYGMPVLGMALHGESLEEKRAIVGLVYGWSELSDFNQRNRQRRINPLSGLLYLLGTGMYHAVEHIVFLTRLYLAETVRWLGQQARRLKLLFRSPPSQPHSDSTNDHPADTPHVP